MHRSRILYAIPLSLVMSGEVFAADQTITPAQPQRSGSKKPVTTETQAQTVEKLKVHARKASTLASSATKSDTPLIETAQSVTVITRNEMDIRNVLNLNQAVRYTAGITPDLRGGGVGSRYDQFALRGFSAPTFLDGLKLQDSPTGYAVAQTDTSRLDRVEILKGPQPPPFMVSPAQAALSRCPARSPRISAPMAASTRPAACSICIAWMPMSAAM